MNRQRKNKKRIEVLLLKSKPKYRGDINKMVNEYVQNGKRHGIIIYGKVDSYRNLLRYVSKLKYVNWVYIDTTSCEISLYSLNVPKLRETHNLDDIKDEIGKILNDNFMCIYAYPVRNILNELTPYYSKDGNTKKIEWNVGKLGKKEVRRKLRRMLLRIKYGK